MEDGEADEEIVEFFPLDRIKSVPEELGDWGGIPDYRGVVESLPDARHCFVFVNYLHHSHVYALRLSPEPRDSSPVLWICGAEHAVMAESLTEFLEAYLADPIGMLFPDELYPGWRKEVR